MFVVGVGLASVLVGLCSAGSPVLYGTTTPDLNSADFSLVTFDLRSGNIVLIGNITSVGGLIPACAATTNNSLVLASIGSGSTYESLPQLSLATGRLQRLLQFGDNFVPTNMVGEDGQVWLNAYNLSDSRNRIYELVGGHLLSRYAFEPDVKVSVAMNALDASKRILYQTARDDNVNSTSGMQLVSADVVGGKLVAQTPLADYLELLVFDNEGGKLLAWLGVQSGTTGPWKTCLAEIDTATGKTGRSVACTTAYSANGGVTIAKGGMVYSSLLTNSQPQTPVWVTVDVKSGKLQATPTDDFAIGFAWA
jgi:hypothetical protein